MRKLLMLVMMLLVPALANAWTFAVKVTNTSAGIALGNKATVTIGTASTDVAANLKYFTPPGSVTVAVANSGSVAVSLVGGTLPAGTTVGTTTTYVIPANATKTLQTLNVVYATAATALKANLSVVQTPGGMTQLQIGSSSTVKGFTSVPVGTTVAVKANAGTGYSLTSVDLNGSALPAPYTFTVADSTADVVTAFYTRDAVVTATLALAQSGQIGTPVTATVTGTGATGYAWTVNGVAQASTTSTMTFNPVAGANNVQVTIAGAAVPVVKSASLMGVNVAAAANYTCTSCHSNSTPAVVTAYNGSAHSGNSVGCQDCHSAGHTTAATSASCESCHVATLSTTTHPAELTATKCLGCHDSHNPAAGIAALTPSNHPAVTLYTFEEVGYQMNNGQPVPVQVDASGKGLPYSPKMTCGTAGCHVINGVNYTYDKISDHAFHSAQGRNEFLDSADGKLFTTKNKPWGQSTAMVGKW